MRADPYSLEHVDAMIDALETKIQKRELSQKLLDGVQQRLDSIEAAHRGSPEFARYYPRLLELQTLVYGESGQEQKALDFLKEAVRQTGSVNGLYSNLLKEYVVRHTPLAAAEVPVHVEAQAASAPAIPVDIVEAAPREKRKHASELHKRPGFGKMKVAFAAVFGLAVISVATMHFVPRAAALPTLLADHSEIASAKQKFDTLTDQYNQCSSKLAAGRGSVNTNDMTALDAYNQDVAACQAVLQQQHLAANRYDALVDAH